MRKDDLNRLRHMLDAAREAVDFARDGRREDLVGDRKLTFALVKDVEIIGEAAYQISEDTRRNLPECKKTFHNCADSFRGFGRRIGTPEGIQQYIKLEDRLVAVGLAKLSLGLQPQSRNRHSQIRLLGLADRSRSTNVE